MEYSKIGLEQFTPDYTRYFHGLPQATRDRLLPRQWQLYKGVSGTRSGTSTTSCTGAASAAAGPT